MTTNKLQLQAKRIAATAAAGALLVTGVGLGSQSSTAAQTSPSITWIPTEETLRQSIGQITPEQWEEIAQRAEAAGDLESAEAARLAARQGTEARSNPTSQAQPQSVWSITRKLIKAALKHGRSYLPSWLRPWADKIYDLIDFIDVTSELAIAAFLIRNGIPPDLARDIAHWIVTFS